MWLILITVEFFSYNLTTRFICPINQIVSPFKLLVPFKFIFILLLLTLRIISLIFHLYIKKSNIKTKVNILETQNQLLENNYNKISSVYTENAMAFHEFNNHLNTLYQLIQTEKYNEVKSYIENISNPIKQLSIISWTGLDILDIMINSKIEQAKTIGINFEINVEFPSNTTILSTDICTILSNLLDNAIEATNQCEGDKTILFTIRRINYFLFIKITNPSIRTSSNFTLFPSTTKSNTTLHGFGLLNVSSVIEKYNGSFKCTNENKKFKVNILIPL